MPKKITYEEVKDYIENISDSEFKLLSKEYKYTTDKLEIQCSKGHIFFRSFNNFKNKNSKCLHCCYDKNKNFLPKMRNFTYLDVKNYIEIESNSGYKLLSDEYITSKLKIKIMCEKGHIYEPRFNDFRKGYRCYECSGSKKHTYQYVKNYIEIESNSSYKLLSEEYINIKTKIKMQCNKGHIYESTFKSFKKGCRCSVCGNSKGENKIENYLEVDKIKYKPQHKIKGCKYKKELPFDFAVFNDDNELLFLIEYQGEQHYKPFNFNRNKNPEIMEENLKKIQLRDKIKKEYCEKNKIPLLTIPYWEFDNIEEILHKQLSKYLHIIQ